MQEVTHISPKGMKNTYLCKAKNYKSPKYVYRRGNFERIMEVRDWGKWYRWVVTERGEFSESNRYLIYLPTASERKQIERMQ